MLTVSDGGVEMCVLYAVVCVLGGVTTTVEGALPSLMTKDVPAGTSRATPLVSTNSRCV